MMHKKNNFCERYAVRSGLIMMFQQDLETLPREELKELQLRRLQDLCARLYANVPFYQRKFDEIGITPKDIKSLSDIKYLPFTEKQDLRDNYPYGLFAMPKENIVRLHASSGTTGKATVVGYTHRDINNWANCMARSFASVGLTQKDMIHIAYGYGLFTGGLGAHYGAEQLGAVAIPMSGGSTKRQIQLMRDFEATALCCTPSYALYLYEAGLEADINFKELPLRIGVFGAEPWTENMRHEIEEKLSIKAYNIYGLSEVMGPGVACECEASANGLMHIQEDHFYPEIIDPITGEQLEDGEEGELVLTTLTKEGVPLLRYRTRDITSINTTPCACGRTFRRINRLKGRSDDMLIIRGVNVYPQQIEGIIIEAEGTAPHYQIIVTREGALDTVEILVEIAEGTFTDTIKGLQQREQKIQKTIKEFLGVTTKVRLVEPKTIERTDGKAKRIIDKR
jgi:Coenzyme F390 synthetase